MTTLTPPAPAAAQDAQALLSAFRELDRVLGRSPERAATIPVPWETPRLLEFIDLAIAHKLWLLADHLLTHLATRGRLSPDQARLAHRVRNLKATMFVQVGQVTPDTPMGQAIAQYVRDFRPKVILDVGAAAGLGTTTTFSKALTAAGITDCTILAVESEHATFDLLSRHAAAIPFAKPIHSALITDHDCPAWQPVRDAIAASSTLFSQFPEDEIHGWYTHGVDLLRSLRLAGKAPLAPLPDQIDIAMIDADLFFAAEELAAVVDRCRVILLDDVHAFKNTANHETLSADPRFELLAHNPTDRHGWSAFRRR
jgi:hypothetical protein